MSLKFRLDKTARAGSIVKQRSCNLACVWCHHDYFTHNGFTVINNADMQQLVQRVIKAATDDDAEVRIAGDGDPTMAGAELVDLVQRCKSIPQVHKVKVTTNGVLLGRLAAPLRDAGVDSVTVSLNALTRSGYMRYAQRDLLDQVLVSIEQAVAVGLHLKINLIYSAWNQDEMGQFEALSCRFNGMPIKVFDLIPTGDGSDLFVPLDKLESALRPLAVSIFDQRNPYAKRTYRLKSGAVFEVKTAGSDNTCPMTACPARSRCLEGCRHSVRIGMDGWMRPCGVRTDNLLNLRSPSATDADIRRALASGGKLARQPESTPISGEAIAV